MNLTPENIQTIGGTRHIVETIGDHVYTSPIIPDHKDILYHDMLPKDQYFRRHYIKQSLDDIKVEIVDSVVSKPIYKGQLSSREKLELEEEIMQAIYRHPLWKAYIDQEIARTRDGLWFYNGYYDKRTGKWHSVPTYLTGYHYMLCQWYQEGNLRFGYRENQRAIHYAWEIARQDENCYGLVLAGSRRFGKSAISSNIGLYDLMLRPYVNIGMQSTNNDLAAKLFDKIVLAWKKYPFFFSKPYTGMETPVNEISYKLGGGMRGLNVDNRFGISRTDDLEHGSVLDYRASGELAYDSTKLYTYIMDEWGKTEECDVNARWGVVKPTLQVDGLIVGKAFCTSTVEDMGTGETLDNAKQFWDNAEKKLETDDAGNKHSLSANGLMRVFIPAFMSLYVDKYGRPEVEKAVNWINQQRALARRQNDSAAIAQIIRQFPMEESDMFVDEGGKNKFDVEVLMARKTELQQMPEQPWKPYSLEWNEDQTEVIPVERPDIVDKYGRSKPDPRGVFRIAWLPPENTHNGVEMKYNSRNTWKPLNRLVYSCVTDPIKNDTPVDKDKMSLACILVAPRLDQYDDDGKLAWRAGVPFIMYHGRPDKTRDYWEDAIKLVHLMGCQILIEQNAEAGMGAYIEERGYGLFLASKPYTNRYEYAQAKRRINRRTGQPVALQKGFHSTSSTKQIYYPLMEVAIEETGHLIPYIDLIEQLINFDINKTQHTDAAVTYGFLCLDLSDRAAVVRTKNKSKLQVKQETSSYQPYGGYLC